MKSFLQIALVVVVIAAVSFLANAGILWLICRLLNMSWWSWKTAAGIWLIEALISSMFNTNVNVRR